MECHFIPINILVITKIWNAKEDHHKKTSTSYKSTSNDCHTKKGWHFNTKKLKGKTANWNVIKNNNSTVRKMHLHCCRSCTCRLHFTWDCCIIYLWCDKTWFFCFFNQDFRNKKLLRSPPSVTTGFTLLPNFNLNTSAASSPSTVISNAANAASNPNTHHPDIIPRDFMYC